MRHLPYVDLEDWIKFDPMETETTNYLLPQAWHNVGGTNMALRPIAWAGGAVTDDCELALTCEGEEAGMILIVDTRDGRALHMLPRHEDMGLCAS